MNFYENDMILTRYKGNFLISDDMSPTRKHQAFDELMKLQKELAGEIYYKRTLDRRNF